MITTVEAWTGELAAAAARIDDEVHDVGRVHAQRVAVTQRSRAPVDTGRLRGSIVVDDDGEDGWSIGPTVDYGRFVEYGTSDTAPQPFVGPSGDRALDGYASDILNAAMP